ncbi:MAG: DDE-type integrase/transposase/recombinase [Clostridiales bacterium]|jgi:transposase InsO family protein|nr:DDE-type integrase/transposase/recombinase [Clostridiales bacterium]
MDRGKRPEEVAGARLKAILPLLDPALDRAGLRDAAGKAARQAGVSVRTVGRWRESYRAGDFEGLKPKERRPPGSGGNAAAKAGKRALLDAAVKEAIELRRAVPGRSVRDIIATLEMEGKIFPPGSVPRSTLQRHLHAAGFSARVLRLYREPGAAAKRFEKDHRCELWMGDIKYGPALPIGDGGALSQTYLAVWIDDATRYVVFARFYGNQCVDAVEDSLRQAVMRYGVPDAAFCDNGRQYRSKVLARACGVLGIRLKFARAYNAAAKGKVEIFNKRADSFLAEAAVARPESLGALNSLFDAWLGEHCHKLPHSGIKGRTPEAAFLGDSRPLRFARPGTLREAFLRVEERAVDKSGCISFDGQKYEVGTALLGRRVEVRRDPTWDGELEVRHEGFEPFMARKLAIGRNVGRKREDGRPERMQAPREESSRLLDGLVKRRDARMGGAVATSFAQLWQDGGEGGADV